MNKQRRKELGIVISLLDRARDLLDCVASDERESFENMPESLQYSERGKRVEENADALEECVSQLEEMIEGLGEL